MARKLIFNPTTGQLDFIEVAITTFLGLSDTPDTYVGQAGKGVRVNGAETALEFYTLVDTDEKVKIDAAATAGYIGATAADGVLRVASPITKTDGGDFVTLGFDASLVDHGALSGLSHDDHTQYARLEGRSGGQTLKGGTGAGEDLSFWTNSTGTVGDYFFTDLFTNGFVKTNDGTGRLSIDTNTYLTTETDPVFTAWVANFNELVDDRVAALLIAGAGIGLTYDDVAGTLTIASTITQYTNEMAQDAVGGAMADSNTIDAQYDDGANQFKWVLVYQDGNGIDLSDDASGLKADIYFASQARGDLIRRGATLWERVALGTSKQVLTSNATDALWATLDSSYISGFNESVDDRVAALLQAGTGITLVYDDVAGTLTINTLWTVSGYSATTLNPVTLTNTIGVGDGNATVPSYSWVTDADTGLYLGSAANIGISLAGTGRYQFGASSLILGAYGAVSANTIDFSFNAATPRLRFGLTYYWQKQVTPPLSGVEYVGNLFPLTDMDTGAELGAQTRRVNKVWTAQVDTDVLGVTEYAKLPFYSSRSMSDFTNIPIQDIYSSDAYTITSGGSSVTLTNHGWQRIVRDSVSGAGKILTNTYAELYISLLEVTASGGSIVDTAHFFEKFERVVGGGTIVNGTPEWDILVTGAHRNRYNGITVPVTGVGTPDTFTVAFGTGYALPDTKYSVELTGTRYIYIVSDKVGVRGTGYIYVKAVVDQATIATTGFSGGVEYQAVDDITDMEIFASHNQGALGAALLLKYGGTGVVYDGVPQVHWAVRRYP